MKNTLLIVFSFISLIAYSQNDVRSIESISTSIQYKASTDALFFEGFDAITLPAGWTDSSTNMKYTWQFKEVPDFPFSLIAPTSTASAICPWKNDTIEQNEWLISPLIAIPDSFKAVTLKFYAGYAKKWIKNADLKIYTGNFTENDTAWSLLWTASSQTDTLDNYWHWREFTKSISAYSGKNIKLGFQYVGNDGDLIAIDNIEIVATKESDQADILNFSINNQVEDPVIDEQNQEIHATVLFGTKLDSLVPTFTLSAGAVSVPASGDTISVAENEAFPIVVTAADSVTKKTWNLFVKQTEVLKDADILSFQIDGQTRAAEIDNINKIITVELSCTALLDSLPVQFELSPGAVADIQPGDTIALQEGIPFEINVTAQDTSVTTTWNILASVRDYHRNITKFSLPQQTSSAIIDTTEHSVFIEVAFGTDISKLVPSIEVSDCGHSLPASGDTVAFENGIPKIYEIYAGDTTLEPQEWLVTIKIARNSLFNFGFDVDTIVPPVDWQIVSNNAKTWTIHKVEDNPFTSVDKRSKFSAVCPWAADSAQDEWLISPEISTQSFADSNLPNMKVEFYLGYNPQFLIGNVNLNFYIKTADTDWNLIWHLPSDERSVNNWYWHAIDIDISSYMGKDIQLAWQYEGINGDLAALDGINIFSDPATTIKNSTQSLLSIQVYPIPSKGQFTVLAKQRLKMQVYSLNGRLILEKNILSQENAINVALKKGIYLIKFSTPEGKWEYKKLIIE